MTKLIQKSALMMALFGLLLVTAAPSAMAQDRGRRRNCNNSSFRNFDDDSFRRDYVRGRRYRDSDYRDYDYDREATTGNAVKRTGIGAGIGALGGALLGGKKGALIGAGIGAAGGYIYHQQKVNNSRGRRYR